MARVELDQIRKQYDNGHVAVEGASFDIRDGELMVLVGPSGCGKSTLLRMIAGLEEISSGTLKIAERIVNEIAPKDRDIAMVFQSYALYPHMSVAENMGFALKLQGMPKAQREARVLEAAQMLELDALLQRKPGQLSGGQRQRVALGRALVRQPQVFLLDEPLSNLDAKLRGSMRVEIARLHRQLGTTMIYVTHDQVEAMTLGQRIVVLQEGRVQQIDTPMALYDRPANLFVAGFLGSPRMNLLQGQLRATPEGWSLFLNEDASLPLCVSTTMDQILRAHADKSLVVGLRPEHMHLGPAEGEPALKASVETVELVGNEAFVNLHSAGGEIAIRVPPRQLPEVGEAVQLGYVAEHMHFFDPATQARIGS